MPFVVHIVSQVLQCRIGSLLPSPSNFGNFSFGPVIIIFCCGCLLITFGAPTLFCTLALLCVPALPALFSVPALFYVRTLFSVSSLPCTTRLLQTVLLSGVKVSSKTRFGWSNCIPSSSVLGTKRSPHARAPSAP